MIIMIKMMMMMIMMLFNYSNLIVSLYWLLIIGVQMHHEGLFAIGVDCNVDICGSVVTKCQLMQSCPCLLDDLDCQKKCLNCLSKLFPSCCSCVELCGTETDEEASKRKSLVGLFNGVPELFTTFIMDNNDDADVDEMEDGALWTVKKFPAYKNLKKLFPNSMADLDPQISQANCTVIYFTTCIPHKLCAQNCESMGASSYRWFEDGCCECAGSDCLSYGLNENHCLACPSMDDENRGDSFYNDDYENVRDDDDDDENYDDLDNLEFGENGINDISKKNNDDNDNDDDDDDDDDDENLEEILWDYAYKADGH